MWGTAVLAAGVPGRVLRTGTPFLSAWPPAQCGASIHVAQVAPGGTFRGVVRPSARERSPSSSRATASDGNFGSTGDSICMSSLRLDGTRSAITQRSCGTISSRHGRPLEPHVPAPSGAIHLSPAQLHPECDRRERSASAARWAKSPRLLPRGRAPRGKRAQTPVSPAPILHLIRTGLRSTVRLPAGDRAARCATPPDGRAESPRETSHPARFGGSRCAGLTSRAASSSPCS